DRRLQRPWRAHRSEEAPHRLAVRPQPPPGYPAGLPPHARRDGLHPARRARDAALAARPPPVAKGKAGATMVCRRNALDVATPRLARRSASPTAASSAAPLRGLSAAPAACP